MIKKNKRLYDFELFNRINLIIGQIPDKIRIYNDDSIIDTEITYDDLNLYVINNELKSLSYENIYEFIGNIIIDINDDIDDRNDIDIIQINRNDLLDKFNLNIFKNNPDIKIIR